MNELNLNELTNKEYDEISKNIKPDKNYSILVATSGLAGLVMGGYGIYKFATRNRKKGKK